MWYTEDWRKWWIGVRILYRWYFQLNSLEDTIHYQCWVHCVCIIHILWVPPSIFCMYLIICGWAWLVPTYMRGQIWCMLFLKSISGAQKSGVGNRPCCIVHQLVSFLPLHKNIHTWLICHYSSVFHGWTLLHLIPSTVVLILNF